MSPSEQRAVRAVRRAIIASEGLMVVDGVPYSDFGDAERARLALAERAVAESPLLRRYIRIDPPCSWCGADVKPTQESREIGGRLLHDTPELHCATEFDDNLDAYAADYAAAHPDAGWGQS